MPKKYTIEEVREIFSDRGYFLLSNNYNGNSIRMDCVCKEGHKQSQSVSSLLSNHSCRQCYNNKRRKFNENVFDIVGVKEAYYLGLLYSDGNIYKNKVEIGLGDEECVYGCQQFFQATNKIRPRFTNRSKKLSYRVSFCSKWLSLKLNELGCVERKSLVVQPPKIDKNLFYPFLLGVFDGDGSVSIRKNKNSSVVTISTGSKIFAEWIHTFLEEDGLLVGKLNVSHKVGRAISYTVICLGLTAKEFLRRMYSSIEGYDITVIKRKKDIYEKIIKLTPKYNNLTVQKWEINLMKTTLSHDEVSKAINEDNRSYWIRTPVAIKSYRRTIKRKHL